MIHTTTAFYLKEVVQINPLSLTPNWDLLHVRNDLMHCVFQGLG